MCQRSLLKQKRNSDILAYKHRDRQAYILYVTVNLENNEPYKVNKINKKNLLMCIKFRNSELNKAEIYVVIRIDIFYKMHMVWIERSNHCRNNIFLR